MPGTRAIATVTKKGKSRNVSLIVALLYLLTCLSPTLTCDGQMFSNLAKLVFLTVRRHCASDREADNDEKDEFGVPYCAAVTSGSP